MSRNRQRASTGAIFAIAAAGGIAMFSGAVLADEVKAPSDPVAKAAFEMLDKHCARCHQEGKLEGRERPAKNFGNVLKLDEIAANPHYILPGNAFGSKLFKQIADKEMPYDVVYEGAFDKPEVSEADLKALQAWIESLGARTAAACTDHKFVTGEDMVALIANDLDKLPKARQSTTRYLTLTHLTNVCTDKDALKVYRQGAVKFINSMSRSSTIVKLEAIDPDESILRINLSDLGWDAADWDKVLSVYPYNLQPDTQKVALLESATGTKLPYVRADWMAFTAAQPPLYDELLKLPKTFQELARQEGVDIEANIRNFVAQRAGFQKSGVSQNNRMIERHPSRSGFFWTSYDFAGNRGKQSLFEHPLGPTGKDAFEHDGGETIYSLPNGFQAYYLNTADGKQLDKGPTTIVRDQSRKDFAVTNGISCMGCHDQGMRKAKDEIRDIVTKGRAFSKDVREKVEGLYPTHDKMDALIEADGKRFTDAMKAAGLEPSLKLNGVEMINALAKRYEDDVDIALAAAEFGYSKDGFLKASDDAAKKFRIMVRRLEQGSVPRDQFEQFFREMAGDLTDMNLVDLPKSNIKTVDGQPRPIQANDLSLTSDKDAYEQGDTPAFTVVSPRDCFLTLTNVDDRGEGTVLLPNKFQRDNLIKAGTQVQFPAKDAPFQFRMKDKGTETVIAVCTEKPANVDGIRHDFARNSFTSVENYTRSIARAIAVEAASGKPAADKSQPGPKLTELGGAPRKSFRAAIKLKVR